MCISCYQNIGSPTVLSDRVVAVVPLIQTVYKHNSVGGNLHVVLDDWNLEDRFFEDETLENFWPEASIEQLNAETLCYNALKDMALAERATALAIFEGFLAP